MGDASYGPARCQLITQHTYTYIHIFVWHQQECVIQKSPLLGQRIVQGTFVTGILHSPIANYNTYVRTWAAERGNPEPWILNPAPWPSIGICCRIHARWRRRWCSACSQRQPWVWGARRERACPARVAKTSAVWRFYSRFRVQGWVV
jgi:hypothetical protein